MPQFSNTTEQITPSAISIITDLVASLKLQGTTLFDFSMGQPDLVTPQYICDAAVSAMTEGKTGYTPTAGTHSLREAICHKYSRDNGIQFERSQIAVGNGAKPLITDILRTLAGQGDEIMIAAPCWTCHPGMVRLVGANPVLIRTSEASRFKITPPLLADAISENSRVLVLNAPANPSGAIYSQAELQALAEVLRQNPKLWIVTDDLYEYIVYDGDRCHSLLEVAPDLRARTVLINGVSKAYAMTGWRIGYAAGPQQVMDNLNKLMSQGSGCASSISQAAAQAAINGSMEFVNDSVAAYQRRRDRVVPALNAINGITCLNPQGAFYLYPGLHDLLGRTTPAGKIIATSQDFAQYLLEEWSVVTVPGAAFELDPYIRISIAAADSELEKGVELIARAVNHLA